MSGSFPFLWIAKHFDAPYGAVLRYADSIDSGSDKVPLVDNGLNAATCLMICLVCEAPWRRSVELKEA